MKNKKMLLGMLVMVLAFGMSVVGCERGGTFTLTNIPREFNGMYALVYAESRTVELIGAQRIILTMDRETFDLQRISGGMVRIPMWIYDDFGDSVERYSGNHTVALEVMILDSATGCCCNSIAAVGFDSVTFRNGSATRSWRDADEVDRW